jgi:hypothetical protein
MQPVVALTGPHGDQYVYGRDSMGSLFGITRYCEDPESAFKFIDYLMSDEVGELTWYGIEGTDYEIVDGEIQFKEDYLKSEDSYRSNMGYNFDGLRATAGRRLHGDTVIIRALQEQRCP